MGVNEITLRCLGLYEDPDFGAARAWLEGHPGGHAIGYMPIYVPREIIHAAGMLPVGILGAGDQLEIIQGDAYYQSYICRIPRSTVELAVTGRLDFLRGMLFPSTCDVIRNLSGMWQLMFPDRYVHYFDVPQDFDPRVGGEWYRRELETLRADLATIAGTPVTDDALRRSIALYNRNRRLVRELYALRSEKPWQAPTSEVYLLLRAGMVLPVEEHNELLVAYLDAARNEERPMRDNCRVVVNGSFCEQPPLNLIRSIEMAGCYIVDDDYLLVTRWLLEDVDDRGDPIESLVRAFLEHSSESAVRWAPSDQEIGEQLVRSVRENRAEGVIFAAPSFCDPALLDRPLLADRLTRAGIPHISFKYAENTGQMQPIREQAGTFADSLKLWSAA